VGTPPPPSSEEVPVSGIRTAPPAPAQLLEAIGRARVVPVVTIRDAADAIAITQALVAGGLPVLEITLRTAAGLEAIRAATGVDGAIVGAGTVLTAEQADLALEAGARFIVSPGLAEDVVAVGRARGVLALPGVATPTEMLRAASLGCAAVKVFPAVALGGPAMVRALASVMPEMGFVPTGGINLEGAASYLAIPHVIAIGGSWMVPGSVLAARDWRSIEELARECAALRDRT
jgi:2-dehydro-3-deoxyphosphogluconate aldolase/(4S)-4-hydroxy-2-oxoglutarate aldolase